ncbi:MAG TPA: YceI family protein [Oculatellaceae cyanobacterium]
MYSAVVRLRFRLRLSLVASLLPAALFSQFSLLLLLSLFAPLPSDAAHSVFKISDSNSRVEFITLRGGQVATKGSFTRLHGTVNYDPHDLTKSSVDVNIPISSLDTKIGVRDSELLGVKYFDGKAFPEASFRSVGLTKGATSTFVLEGVLSLHGAKKLIKIKMDNAPKLATKNGHTLFTAEGFTSIDQNDFGLSLLKLHPDGYMRINDLVGIKITLQAGN